MADAGELFARALDLHVRGIDEEAKAAYVEVLRADSTHYGALTNLGTLLFNAGYRTAARTAYRQAVACHPESVQGRVNYANALYENNELFAAAEHYRAAIALDERSAAAHQGLSYALERLGEHREAQLHRDLGFRGNAIVHVPYRGSERAVVVLQLVGSIGGNVRIDHFFDDRVFFVTKLFCDYYDPNEPLPFHEFVFNAIGDADLCSAALEGARAVLQRTNARVINAPAAVARTGRVENAARLAGLPGVIAPRTRSFERDELAGPGGAELLEREGFRWPLLLRTPGFHTGMNFSKVEGPGHLAAAVESLPGERLTAIEFLDARSADGKVRKYRAMIVDGAIYPLHLAIADRWKVHYFTAAMDRPEDVEEEAAFLRDMPAALGPRATAALESIRDELALDYAGIDFGLDAQGNVLFFEANATMVVPRPSDDPRTSHRREAIERIFSAVRAMLLDRRYERLGTRRGSVLLMPKRDA